MKEASYKFDNLSDDEEQLLLTRSMRLQKRKAEEEEEESTGLEVASFPLGKGTWAIPLESLVLSAPLKGVTPVPLARKNVIGIYRFQGSVISIFSLASLLNISNWNRDPAVMIIIRGNNEQFYAFDSEEIPETIIIPHATIEAARAKSDSASKALAITMPDRRLIHLIDLDKLKQEEIDNEQK